MAIYRFDNNNYNNNSLLYRYLSIDNNNYNKNNFYTDKIKININVAVSNNNNNKDKFLQIMYLIINPRSYNHVFTTYISNFTFQYLKLFLLYKKNLVELNLKNRNFK